MKIKKHSVQGNVFNASVHDLKSYLQLLAVLVGDVVVQVELPLGGEVAEDAVEGRRDADALELWKRRGLLGLSQSSLEDVP